VPELPTTAVGKTDEKALRNPTCSGTADRSTSPERSSDAYRAHDWHPSPERNPSLPGSTGYPSTRGSRNMSQQSLSAFVQAVRSGEPDRIRQILTKDVVLNSPILDDPILGPDAVSGVLGVLAGIVDELSFGEVLVGESHYAVHLTGRVSGHALEAMEYLDLDVEGRVRALTVLARPLASVVALQNLLAPTLGAPKLSLAPAAD
jgi:hypothetical protein